MRTPTRGLRIGGTSSSPTTSGLVGMECGMGFDWLQEGWKMKRTKRT